MPMLARAAHFAVSKRIARGSVKHALRRYLKGNTADVAIDGLTMRCHFGDNHTEQAIIDGRGDKNLHLIGLIMKDIPDGGTFVDVGANCGLYSIFAARAVGPTGKVVSIEPLHEMFDRLTHNVAANGFSNVHTENTAVGAHQGAITINVHKGQFGQSSVSAVDGYEPRSVNVDTLKAILDRAGVDTVHALKIDIEGFEDMALIPYFELTPRNAWPHKILIETVHAYRWKRDCMQVMAGLGYSIVWSDKTDSILQLGGH